MEKIPKVVVAGSLDEEFFKLLKGKVLTVKAYDLEHEDLASLLKDAHVVVVRSNHMIDKTLIDEAKCLKIIARAGVGLDNVDVDYALKHGITVLSTPNASTEAVAELTIGLMIALARRITVLDSDLKSGRWCKDAGTGVELKGKTLGVVGFGRIGCRVAELARVFGMRVIAYDPYVDPARVEGLGVGFKTSLDELLRESDVVSIHASLTDETRRMIGERELRLMKQTAYLINTARGAIVDEDALVKALKKRWIAGAALDVYEEEPLPENHPLRSMENTILTPHIGGSTVDAQRRIGRSLAEKILKTLKKKVRC